jgi:C4-dicarboxylate-specific signal transduction histidine kinase
MKHRTHTEMLMTYAERENSMVSSLLTAAFPLPAAPEARPDAPVPRATLSDVTEAVLKILRPDLERCDRHVVVEVTKASESLAGDPAALAQVLADLLESVSRGALTKRVMVRVTMERADVVITACEEGLSSGVTLARELTDRYGNAISCSAAAANGSVEIVVRVRG